MITKKKYRLISFVIPTFNEQDSILELISGIEKNVKPCTHDYEILMIDDGSTDASAEIINKVAKKNKHIKLICLRKNFGKATALDVGFKLTKGEVVFTMDADLQDDPIEITKMLNLLDTGVDVVSGWKKKRYDPWHKTIPSKFFNYITRLVSRVKIHDFNCGYKLYRKEVVKNMHLYGEMHRYIPALAYWKGFKVTELEVHHHSRKYGHSKYGMDRLFKGLFDFLTIAFITKFMTKPMHFFGIIGLIMTTLGGLSGLYLSTLFFLRELFSFNIGPLGDRPLLSFSVLTLLMGILFFATGLLAEMLIYLTRETEINPHLIKEFQNEKPPNLVKSDEENMRKN
jgi:glycosyltransferase involved in cell wall biosynthesis